MRHDANDQARDWVLRLNAPTVTAAVRQEFESWRAQSTANRVAWDDCQQFWALLGSLGQEDREQIETQAPVPPARRPRARRWLIPTSLAASLLAAMVLWLVAPSPRAWLADVRTAVGERRALTLDDGSRIEMSGSTALSVSLMRERREIELISGQASFDVARDGRPFVVRSGDAEITVTGTRFDVLQRGSEVELVVEEGHVAAAWRGGRAVHVGVAQRVIWRNHDALEVTEVDLSEQLAWKRNLLVFRSAPLGSVMDQLAMYKRGRILLSARARDELVTGSFDTRKPEAVLDAIEQSLPVDVIRLTPWLTLIR